MANPTQDQIVTIRRGVTRLARRLRVERPPSALSGNKIAVLASLYRNGPTTPGAIAAAEHQQPQSLTRVFADLEADGLVLRVRSETDRRAWVLHLTVEGREALRADMAHRDAWLEAALDDLTDAELGLLEIAAQLMERIAR
ncbi:MarR family winged helix-turn-helix transcriptional regulator [Cryptosporangium phraense]|uniref:MarR family transcriptional regulator n=1 Tax=Cryptosporangium phraense TaxID=2593070 RepID=A0A545AYN3_9ACTN|nr:MarR family transcriptional regulator [Cryptosporangium phraense]TQS46457.1 MarR family transcriptional regulator [Cryptosporangium phraense]